MSKKPPFQVCVIGAGLIGISITKELIKKNYNVILIDKLIEISPIKSPKNLLFKYVKGDACELSTLEDAKIAQVQTVVSATRDDKVNLIVSLLAKTKFNIPTVIAKVNDVKNEWLFTETWGVDKYISQTRLITSLIEDSFEVGNFVKLFSFGKSHENNTSLYEYSVPEKSSIVGKMIRDLKLPVGAELIIIIRDQKSVKPYPDSAIEAGDQLIFIADERSEKHLK
jgi:trk system potassium uptake protein TrkA